MPEQGNESAIHLLAAILQQEQAPLWQPSELGAILQHQLDAPLQFEFADNGTPAEAPPPGIGSFRALLLHADPPPGLLQAARRFAKGYMNEPAGALPAEVATVVYFASIVAARLRLGEWITSLDESAARAGIDWALRQPWMDMQLAGLLQEGMKAIGGPPPA